VTGQRATVLGVTSHLETAQVPSDATEPNGRPPMSSSSPEELDLKVEDTDAGHIIYVRGELDLASAPQLSEALTAPSRDSARPVLLDLSEVTFIDSSALRALVLAGRELAGAGRTLQIGPRSEMVTRVLSMTSLDQQTDAFEVLPVNDA
jgi:anti-sigma B factor antagonist